MSIPAMPVGVNPDELELVLAGLRRLDAPQLRLSVPPERLGGGFWAEMWLLQLDDHGPHLPTLAVLRLAPDPRLAAWETAVQRGVAEQNYPTPAILASGDATPATRFWSVMEYAGGQPLLAGLSGVSALAKLPRLARALPAQLASCMAALHALDPTPIEEALITVAGHQAGGVAGLLDHYAHRARLINDTALINAVEDLARTRPPVDRRVVCHGDLHPFNILDNDGALTVLDWTAARIADPAYDVAFTALLLANPPLAAPVALQPIIGRAGHVLSRRFVRAYRAMTGGIGPDDTRLEWHTKVHAIRILLDIDEWRTAGVLEHHNGHPWLAMENVVRRAIDRPTAAA